VFKHDVGGPDVGFVAEGVGGDKLYGKIGECSERSLLPLLPILPKPLHPKLLCLTLKNPLDTLSAIVTPKNLLLLK